MVSESSGSFILITSLRLLTEIFSFDNPNISVSSLNDGNIWIVETKGGMQAGHTKNIDRQVENKFNAFKEYAKKYNLHWGFVRDIDEELYINNTIYTEDMSGDNWIPLDDVLK